MPHISQKSLKKEDFLKIKKQMVRTIAPYKERHTKMILGELLTGTEQLMLAKRLAIIFMLIEGFSFYRIEKTLNVSTSTIIRIYKARSGGAYQHIALCVKKKKRREEFLDTLEFVLRAGLPPIAGPGRWKNVNRLLYKK